MKAALMSKLGVDDRVAANAIASLPNNVLGELIEFVERYGPYAKAAILAALPFLLKGDTWGAIKALILYLISLIPAPPQAEVTFATGKIETPTDAPTSDAPPAPTSDAPKPPQQQPHQHGKRR